MNELTTTTTTMTTTEQNWIFFQ